MSVLENLKSRPITAADIALKLEVAQSELAGLEAKLGAAALDALTSGNDAPLSALRNQLNAARNKVTELSGAHAAAIARDEQRVVEQRNALRKSQIASLRQHLTARAKAAKTFSEKMAEAVDALYAIQDHSAKAQRSCPVGSTWPNGGTLTSPDELHRAIAAEMWRLSAGPGNTNGRALPGSQTDDMSHQYNPQGIKPIATQIDQANAFALKKLTGKDE